MMRLPDTKHPLIHLRVGAAIDSGSVNLRSAALLLGNRRIAGIGPANEVSFGPSMAVDRPNWCLLPGLVNTHCHLDLTHLGPQPHLGDFVGWIDRVRQSRAADEEELRRSISTGIELSLRGGSCMVGDIAGFGCASLVAQTLAASPLHAVCFAEFFGIGSTARTMCALMDKVVEDFEPGIGGGRTRLGLQPHSPFSAHHDVFSHATMLSRRLGLPLSTHLSETPEEIEFCRFGTGPLMDFLHRIGRWDDAVPRYGLHPIEAIRDHLSAAPWIAAHVNYCDLSHLAILARTRTTVAYCPRASAYFGHQDHPYRLLLDSGVNVALGTDSIICLDSPDRLSVLDEMRLLYQRDRVNARTLLAMATVNGCRALGFDEDLVTLSIGPKPSLIAVEFDPNIAQDPLEQMLSREAPPAIIDVFAEIERIIR